MLGGVVKHKGTVRNRSIEECMGGCRRRRRAEIDPAEKNRVVRMCGRVALEALDQLVGLARRDARFRGGEIQPVQSVSPEQQMQVRVDNPGYDGAALEVDDLGVPAAALCERRAAADGLDASAGDGERLGPRYALISGVDVAVDQQGVRAERT